MVNIKRKISFILLSLIIAVFICNPIMVNAQDFKVYDEGNLFTEDEIIRLNDEANTLSYNYDMDIVIVTTEDAEGKTAREFADDYYDYNGFNDDGILFLIDMDNREAYISTKGLGIRYLTDYRIESIIEDVLNELRDEDFYGASQVYLNDLEGYLQSGIPSNQYSEDENTRGENKLTFLEAIISLIVGFIGAIIFNFGIKSKYKMKNIQKPMNFRNNSIVNMSTNQDMLVDSFITHRIIKKDNDNNGDSGRSSTHTSSSGSTHGGGGGKF